MPLRFGAPDMVWPEDSIPEHAGERILIEREYNRGDGEVGYLVANWVVVLINRSYKETRSQVRDGIIEAFGIESERDLHSTGDGKTPNYHKLPNEPLFGDGFTDFRAIGVPIAVSHEYRIQTKPYNTHVRWWKSSSVSEWRVIDGAPLFHKACTLLVVSRIDQSREWLWLHPGIPTPFTTIYETRLVTDKEVNVIATLLGKLGHPLARYFVPYPGHRDELSEMRAIREAAQNLPER